MGDKLALVIPTLNEDDESTDETGAVVREYSRSDSRIRLLVRRGCRGLAGAVIYGWDRTDATLLGVIDADLQHPPELLPALVAALRQGHDMAVASRYSAGNGIAGWNPVRRAISQLSTWITVPLQKPGIRVRDPLSGFFMLRRSCITGVRLQPEGFKLLLEILVRGNIRSVTEIPYRFGLRHAGKSKATLRVGLDYLQLLGRLSRSAFSRSVGSA